MTTVFNSCIGLLGADFVAHVADQNLGELGLPARLRARCVKRFTDPALENDGARLRLYLLGDIGDRKLDWPRLTYWRDLFDQLGGQRPHTWTKGVFQEERRKSGLWRASARQPLALIDAARPAPRDSAPARERRVSAIRLDELHQSALLGLLQHYVQFICYAERDRRQIANLGVESCLMLSKDAAEQRIERMWLDGLQPGAEMWRPEPPFFPGHRATLRPHIGKRVETSGATRSDRRSVWVWAG